MAQSVQVTIERGDITTFETDVIVLKVAQSPHGADRLVANQLIARGITEESLRPAVGQTRFLATNGAVLARSALFVGTPSIYSMSYTDVRALAATALSALKT